ncbi:MAG: extracellular solute-binding protein [Nocardiopsaceae bacterium]|nr:extracellular solute-binding protein [Nocardiopsaceae bacterium]
MTSRFRRLAAGAAAAMALVTLAACGSGGGSSASSSGPVTLTFWTWLGTGPTQKLANEFTKTHPNIKVNVVNAGRSQEEYTKLDTALKAGKGAPDIAQIEYFALPQYAITQHLVNLSGTSAASVIKSKFTPAAQRQVTVNGGIYAFPQDVGPMAMFYRKDLFKKAGLKPPKTWAQYAADAAAIHKKLPQTYMGNVDPGDPGTATSLMWQAGATPFRTTGTTHVTVNLDQPAVRKWASLWSGLLEKKLVTTDTGWTASWWHGMAAGRYATWITGAWAPVSMYAAIAQTKSDWAVAPIPQWTPGAHVDAQNGGSSSAVLSSSPHKAQAIEFLEWLDSSQQGAKQLANLGLFPPTKALLNSPSWLNAPQRMLDNQKANKVLAQAGDDVAPGWQYLPYQVYANSVFADSVGHDISAGKNLIPGLQAWQKSIVSYGNSQGFSVKTGS